jgi:hypothetical protein
MGRYGICPYDNPAKWATTRDLPLHPALIKAFQRKAYQNF